MLSLLFPLCRIGRHSNKDNDMQNHDDWQTWAHAAYNTANKFSWPLWHDAYGGFTIIAMRAGTLPPTPERTAYFKLLADAPAGGDDDISALWPYDAHIPGAYALRYIKGGALTQ